MCFSSFLVRTRRNGSSNESRGDSVRKTSEKGRERKSSLEKEADPVPPKKSKVVVKARPPGKVADKIVEENEEEVDEKADDSDLNGKRRSFSNLWCNSI